MLLKSKFVNTRRSGLPGLRRRWSRYMFPGVAHTSPCELMFGIYLAYDEFWHHVLFDQHRGVGNDYNVDHSVVTMLMSV